MSQRMLRSLLKLNPLRRRLLLRAAFELLRAGWRVRHWSFARLVAATGPLQALSAGSPEPQPEQLPQNKLEQVREAAWAVAAWSRRWPWPPTCLMQALAARHLLDELAAPSRLYFGVRPPLKAERAAPAGVQAHAWLCCGELVVTGAAEANQHQAIAVICSPGRDGQA